MEIRPLVQILVVAGLLLLIWFMLQPQAFLHAPVRPPETWVSPSPPLQPPASHANTNAGVERLAKGQEIPPDALLETGSGKEVPGEKLVRFSSAEAYQRFLAMAPPGSILGMLDVLNSVRVKSGSWLGDALAKAKGTVSGNFYVRVPEVPLEVRQKGDTLYQPVGKKALDLMGAGEVDSTWGHGVKVALMDTPLEGVEMVPGETVGHGTAMRSLIQGQTGSARGAAPGSEVVAFSVLDQDGKGTAYGLAEAILRATDLGVRVINMSLGSDGDSPVVRDAVAYALARNVVLVGAAGNDAVNRVSYPAAYDGVVAVASVDAAGNQLYFSNRGPALDLAAPGYAVVAAWPAGKTAEVSGTSASTALVSGVVTALLSREPGLSGKQAADLLVKYADATGLPGAAEDIGGGVVNLQRVLERNRRGIVDVAVGGVTLKEEGSVGRILVGIQNRGTETVNSPSLQITAGSESRTFYFGSLAPGGTATESMTFDLTRARQAGGISAGALVRVASDQRNGNDSWAGYFRISK